MLFRSFQNDKAYATNQEEHPTAARGGGHHVLPWPNPQSSQGLDHYVATYKFGALSQFPQYSSFHDIDGAPE